MRWSHHLRRTRSTARAHDCTQRCRSKAGTTDEQVRLAIVRWHVSPLFDRFNVAMSLKNRSRSM